MNCIHPPTSLQDAEAIVACYGGQEWRTAFGYGLITVLVVGLVVLLLAWGLAEARR